MSLTVNRYFHEFSQEEYPRWAVALSVVGTSELKKTNKDYTKICAILISENHKVLKLQNVENSLGSECCIRAWMFTCSGWVGKSATSHTCLVKPLAICDLKYTIEFFKKTNNKPNVFLEFMYSIFPPYPKASFLSFPFSYRSKGKLTFWQHSYWVIGKGINSKVFFNSWADLWKS